MKLLVVGIDGVDRRIIDSMDMPNLQNILQSGLCLELEEDLWSRGWSEILTGVHGRESGAFYNKPVLNGSHCFTQHFTTHDYKKNKAILPLWERICNNGHTVGFMNVPTTNPAPHVNGFFVSGAGAGLSQKGFGAIPTGAIFPQEITNILKKQEYIFDIRFKASGIRDIDEFFNSLNKMVNIRTNAFRKLVNKYHPGFGFLSYMAACRFQYLAMSEIESLIKNNGKPETHIQKCIKEFYKKFDGHIKELIEAVGPERLIICSDHAQAPYLRSVNVNRFLQKIGMQSVSICIRKTAKLAIKNFSCIFPGHLQRKIFKQRFNYSNQIIGKKMNCPKTMAFGARYVPGIYINDVDRFGGPVGTEEETKALIEKIIYHFNSLGSAQEHCLKARPYRERYSDAYYSDVLPDIWIDHPDTIFFEGEGDFIIANRAYGPITSFECIDRDMYTGIKGKQPLLCVDSKTASYLKKKDPMDLTVAYKVIERIMSK